MDFCLLCNKIYHMRNTFGNLFTLTSFGESHGAAIGGVVDGMPAGINIDLDFIQHELSRRRPGQSRITTQRKEADEVELLSGVFEGRSTGTPIGFIVRNTNQHSYDYDNMRGLFRPSHADYTYFEKYGIRDHRGGGRSSARITISRCVGGALAKLALRPLGITIQAYVSQVGDIALDRDYHHYDLSQTESNIVRCPDPETAQAMERLIMEVKNQGDTIGGVITCVIKGCPVGLGEPEFGKLNAQLGAAMLGINAVKATSSSTTTATSPPPPTTAAASRAASATVRTSASALPSSPSLPCSWSSRRSTSRAAPPPSTPAAATTPASCPAPYPSSKPWPPWSSSTTGS